MLRCPSIPFRMLRNWGPVQTPVPVFSEDVMRVYFNSDKRGSHTVHIRPAADFDFLQGQPPASDWLEDDGRTPRQIAVVFTDGAAEVSDSVGKYLIAAGHARATRLIVPPKPDLIAPGRRKDRQ